MYPICRFPEKQKAERKKQICTSAGQSVGLSHFDEHDSELVDDPSGTSSTSSSSEEESATSSSDTEDESESSHVTNEETGEYQDLLRYLPTYLFTSNLPTYDTFESIATGFLLFF